MARLITALALCEFHVDEGNTVHTCHPPATLTPEELQDISFSAFPDSLSLNGGLASIKDSQFYFCIRRRSSQGPAAAFLHGYCFCRQRCDEGLRRGGEQRSVLVLSYFPLACVLQPLVQHVAPLVFTYGPELLERVWEEVQRWPEVAWGTHMVLPLGPHSSLSVELPEASTLPVGCQAASATISGSSGSSSSSSMHRVTGTAEAEAALSALVEELDADLGLPLCLLQQAHGERELVVGPFDGGDVYTPLCSALEQLWALWEAVILGEPLLVLAPTPGGCSAAVGALLSLLTPLPVATDYRPYFTIHDPAFVALASGGLPDASNGLPSLLGATNLHFLRALSHYPNVLSTGYTPATSLASFGSTQGLQGSGSNGNGAALPASSAAASARGRLAGLLGRRPSRPQALLQQGTDCAWLSFKPLCRPDRGMLASLMRVQAGDPPEKQRRLAALNSSIIRQHFQELNKALLFPLLPFITPAQPPADGTAELLTGPPALPELQADALLACLASRNARLPEVLLQRFGGQRGVVAFYEQLLASRNLTAWLEQRRAVAQRWQDEVWSSATSKHAAVER